MMATSFVPHIRCKISDKTCQYLVLIILLLLRLGLATSRGTSAPRPLVLSISSSDSQWLSLQKQPMRQWLLRADSLDLSSEGTGSELRPSQDLRNVQVLYRMQQAEMGHSCSTCIKERDAEIGPA